MSETYLDVANGVILPSPQERADALRGAVQHALATENFDLSELAKLRDIPGYTVLASDRSGHLPTQEITPEQIVYGATYRFSRPRLFIRGSVVDRPIEWVRFGDTRRQQQSRPKEYTLRPDNLDVFMAVTNQEHPRWDTIG
jgi:hypothetical protein